MALPDEVIVEEILMRLPVKLVVRFRSVCKLWNYLLSQPRYIQPLLNCSISQTPDDDYLVCVNRKARVPDGISILSCTYLSEICINNVPYLVCVHDHIELVGSINGVVCIAIFCLIDSRVWNYHFILWNPVMNLFKKILPPKDCPSKYTSPAHNLFGFGWDSVANNYKIIVHATDSVQAVVYSCETDSWSKIAVSKSDRIPDNVLCWSQPVNVKGICYWSFLSAFGQVLKFEARNNKFTYLRVPRGHKFVQLINLNDRLARIEYKKLGNDHVIDYIDVYCLSDESGLWSKIYTDIRSGINDFKRILSCFKSGAMIVLNKEYKEYNMYDPNSNEIKSLACRFDLGPYYYLARGLSYTPSLVALEGMKSSHL